MKLPQLSLRELFLLVVIAAMGCGWWVERAGFISRLHEAEAWKAGAGALQELVERKGWSVNWVEDEKWINLYRPGEATGMGYRNHAGPHTTFTEDNP